MGIGSALQFGLIGALVLGAGLAVWLAFRSARKRGQAEVQHKHAEESAGMAQEALEIDDEVARLDSDDLDDELRD